MRRKLSEHMEAFRADRPSEWLMDEWIGIALGLEQYIENLEAHIKKPPTNEDMEEFNG